MATDTPFTIYLESNPNPNSLKFVANKMLVADGTNYDFPGPDEAEKSALAKELFLYPFVDRVFITSNFVTVTKKDEIDWFEIQETIKSHILKFLQSGQPLISTQHETDQEGEDSETVSKIKQILDDYIKPAVEQDGGAITFHAYADKAVTVVLQGACSGCPSSTITLKSGIENLFKKMMPEEVESVEALEG